MKNEPSPRKALDAAYRMLVRRGHSRAEVKQKLSRKGFCDEDIEETLTRLAEQGYLNDDDIALRWAHSLVENKGWGKAKVASYLVQKGISRDGIERAQREVWLEFREEEIARKALKKHFALSEKKPATAKAASFLQARGFSAEVIYRVVSGLQGDEIE